MDDSRVRRLTALGAAPSDLDALAAAVENRFAQASVPWPITLPLESEPHVAAWREYADRVAETGTFTCLRDVFPQLRFPVSAGLSGEPDYAAATRRGEPTGRGDGLALTAPDRIVVVIHETAAGAVPLVIVREREDFVALVRAFTHRNEPAVIPDSQGASMVAGYNNWDRVARYRRAWESASPRIPDTWPEAFRGLAAQPAAYQDRFILLSDGPYSAVPADAMGLSDSAWRDQSLAIRREHECAHYFTKRVYGIINDRLHDEFLADAAGIIGAAGAYRADWFQRFMGIEAYPAYRPGGRLENYQRAPALPETAVAVLRTIVRRASDHLEAYCRSASPPLAEARDRAALIVAAASLALDEMAADDGPDRWAQAVDVARTRLR